MEDALQGDAGYAPRSAVATALFLAMMMFLFITTTPFADINAIASDPQASNSNLLNQIVVSALTVGLAAYGLRHPLGRSVLFQPRALLVPLFLWFAAGSLFCPSPDTALRKVVLAAMVCLDASVFLLLPRCGRHFAKLLLISTGIMLLVAYAGVALLPGLAIHQATELIEPEHAGLWHGQFPHKNEAAAVMVLAFFIGLFTFRAGYRRASLAVMVASAWFLVHTGGKSATAHLPATLLVAWAFERWRWSRVPIAVGGLVLFNAIAIGCALSEGISASVASLGIDPTFTNRTDIWRIALDAIGRSPILGYGFQGFWQTDDLFYSGGGGVGWAVQAFNGHNSWIDLVLTTGLPALALVVPWFVLLPLRDVARAEATGNDPELTRLFTRIWLYGLLESCLETTFFQSDPVWFAFLFSLSGLRLQGSAQVRDFDRAPARPSVALDPAPRPSFGLLP
jgi:O-antigen ligase